MKKHKQIENNLSDILDYQVSNEFLIICKSPGLFMIQLLRHFSDEHLHQLEDQLIDILWDQTNEKI